MSFMECDFEEEADMTNKAIASRRDQNGRFQVPPAAPKEQRHFVSLLRSSISNFSRPKPRRFLMAMY